MCHIDDSNNGGKVPEEIESPTGSHSNFTRLIRDCYVRVSLLQLALNTMHSGFFPIVNNRVTSVGWNESGFSMTTRLFQSVRNTCRLRVFPPTFFGKLYSFPPNIPPFLISLENLTIITIS